MKLLFICTHNRCRSILAEAITNHMSDGTLEARSAGSEPAGEVHPLTIKYLQEKGIETDSLQSQSWDDMETYSPDVVITVCDSAAKEACPIWFGNCIQVHWGLNDPSKMTGPEDEVRSAFFEVMQTISNRIQALIDLHPDQIKPQDIQTILQSLEK